MTPLTDRGCTTYGIGGDEKPWVQVRGEWTGPLETIEARVLARSLVAAADSAEALMGNVNGEPVPEKAAKPQHALVLIGSSANSESAESTLFVRDLQSEAVFKIQGVRV